MPGNVVIGERSWLYSTFAFRHYQSRRPVGVKVGSDTGLYNGTFFDLGPLGEVSIGNYCTLVGAVICTNRRVEIADYAFIAHEVVIADCGSASPAWPAVSDSQDLKITPRPAVSIGENAWIGARAILLAGASIGEGSIVGAASVIDFPVPPFSVAAGNPARIVKTISVSER